MYDSQIKIHIDFFSWLCCFLATIIKTIFTMLETTFGRNGYRILKISLQDIGMCTVLLIMFEYVC